ncbi:MAG: toll/interleukin-1 receptor domain-containing protein [Clostridia bacterium]|nr:toll/interleukin-1 receptor domain-containing protein [Clostridia bacterium]
MGKTMNKDVFVSYTTPDRRVAEDIVAFLEKQGVDCFIAPRDVDPGQAYAANLMQAINNCRVIILVASDAMNRSSHVLNEIEAIINKQKPLVPFFIEDFQMNDEFCYYLSRTQRIVAYPDPVSSYYNKLFSAIMPMLPQKQAPAPAPQPASQTPVNQSTTTVFEYIPSRGIMINPEDHQRNVSFRTDTFINMFGGIFDNVVSLAGLDKARSIFHESGYHCGQNFAQRLNSSWEFGGDGNATIESKLKKWCEFDSQVGWGKFDIHVDVNEETGDFNGELTINESFIVDRKERKQICEFVRGYCEGVIETLLCVKVHLECIECPMKNRFKSVCKFRIELED